MADTNTQTSIITVEFASAYQPSGAGIIKHFDQNLLNHDSSGKLRIQKVGRYWKDSSSST